MKGQHKLTSSFSWSLIFSYLTNWKMNTHTHFISNFICTCWHANSMLMSLKYLFKTHFGSVIAAVKLFPRIRPRARTIKSTFSWTITANLLMKYSQRHHWWHNHNNKPIKSNVLQGDSYFIALLKKEILIGEEVSRI